MGTFCIWDFAPSLKERSRYSCYYRMSFSCEVVSKIVCGPPSCWHFNYSSTDIFLSISLSSSIRRMTIFISFRQKNMMQDNIVYLCGLSSATTFFTSNLFFFTWDPSRSQSFPSIWNITHPKQFCWNSFVLEAFLHFNFKAIKSHYIQIIVSDQVYDFSWFRLFQSNIWQSKHLHGIILTIICK